MNEKFKRGQIVPFKRDKHSFSYEVGFYLRYDESFDKHIVSLDSSLDYDAIAEEVLTLKEYAKIND